MNLKPGALISDRYRIIEKIATGGMSVIYKAKDEKLDREVTFKVLKEDYINDNEFVKRFRVEAMAVARLSHVNIVNVYDAGDDGDIYYIVMEYIDGCSLKELINKKAPFDNQEALGVAIQIASGLEHAHANGIIHRDIKPQNILITKDEKGGGKVKVTDFGIARATTSNTTTTNSLGSVHYFSPEQARGGFVDNKSDIYSLGIVMFEMVTGVMPFDGETPVELAMKHINEPMPDIKRFNPNVSDSIVQIILKATEKLSGNRYQSVDEMNNDLKRALTNASGDFVKRKANVVNDDPTVAISQEQFAQIRDKANKIKPKVNEIIVDIDGEEKNNVIDNQFSKEEGNDGGEGGDDKKVIILAVVAAIAIIAILTSLGAFVVNKINNPSIKMPDFEGMTIEEAEKLAVDNDIYIVKETKSDSEVEEGIILEQDIEPNQKVKKNAKVTLTVSTGSEKVELDNVVNLSEDEAEKLLVNAGFELETTEYEYSADVEAGNVIKTSPEAGAKVDRGSSVKLYVSRGGDGDVETVPGVEGMTKEKAIETLEEKGFEVKALESYSATVKKDEVIDQGVQAGSEVPKGYVITITVSKGEDPNVKKEEVTETTTRAEVITTPAVAKKIVSIPVNPAVEGGSTSIGPDGQVIDREVTIMLVAKDGTNTRTVIEKSFAVSDFPFTVNDQIDKDTNYELYVDGKLVSTQTERY